MFVCPQGPRVLRRGRGGAGGSPAPAWTPVQASSQHGCPVPPQCAKLVESTRAKAMLRLPRMPEVEVGEMGMGLCPGAPSWPHSPRCCTASKRVRGHPLFLPLLRGPHLLLGRGGDNNWDVPLLLLVQQVGDGGDTAQPPPCCTESSRVRVSQQSGPSQWLQAARRDGEPTEAIQ